MSEIGRNELADWLKKVKQQAPDGVRRYVPRELAADPRTRSWCIDAPRHVVAVLEDEARLRGAAERHQRRRHADAERSHDIKRKLRDRFSPWPEQQSLLEEALEGEDVSAATREAVEAFTAALNTVETASERLPQLVELLDDQCTNELLAALQAAEIAPERAGKLRAGIDIANQVLQLEQRHARNAAAIERAPEELRTRLEDQSDVLERIASEIERLDEQLGSRRDARMRVTSDLEQEELRRSQLDGETERLVARFDAQLARAIQDPSIDAQALYEAFRQRTERERVWRERQLADDRADQLTQQLKDLREAHHSCVQDRHQLNAEVDAQQTELAHLWDRVQRLENSNHYLSSLLAESQDESRDYAARGQPVTILRLDRDVLQSLKDADLLSLGELAAALPKGLTHLPGIGPRTEDHIRSQLEEEGLY